MRAKAVGGECAPDRSLAPVHHGRGRVRGDLATPSRAAESEDELALALGVGRRRAVPFVGESPGVERRDDDWARGARDDELVARSVEVDAERELFEPLGYGEGKDSERDVRSGLPAETGGVREQSSALGRDMLRRGAGEPCGATARRPPSFGGGRGGTSEGVGMPGMFSVFSEARGETPKGE